MIEHNLDVIRAADWIIDLGPEGGDAGGEVVCSRHAARQVMAERASHTGKALRDYESRTRDGARLRRSAGIGGRRASEPGLASATCAPG